MQIFEECLYRWQTLLTGGAALLSGYLLYRQTKQTEIFYRNELDRRHSAARCVLPITLSAVAEMCTIISAAICSEFETLRASERDRDSGAAIAPRDFPTKFEAIVIYEPILEGFQRFVETLTCDADVRHVAELISSIQILISRYNSFDRSGIVSYDSLISALLDVAKVRLLNGTLFNYGRFVDGKTFGLVEKIPEKEIWDKIKGKAHELVFVRRSPDIFFPRLTTLFRNAKRAAPIRGSKSLTDDR